MSTPSGSVVARASRASNREASTPPMSMGRNGDALRTSKERRTTMGRNRRDRADLFLRALTTVHGAGCVVLVFMTGYVLLGEQHAQALARTPGAQIMVRALGKWLPVFLAGLACFLGALAWGSQRRLGWAWTAAVVAYSVGIVGSAWEIVVGINQAWVSLLVNGAVVTMLFTTREAYFEKRKREAPPLQR
jgi:hypothetical protein